MRRSVLILTLVAACGTAREADASPAASSHKKEGHTTLATQTSQATHADGIEAMLAAVSAVHGGSGPWAVVGYRIGQRALTELGLAPHSFDLEVKHQAPREVQYSCIVDGVQAATGASQGKLNLALETASVEQLATVVSNRKTGASLTFRLRPALVQRISDVPRERFAAESRFIAAAPDEELFEVTHRSVAKR